MVVGGGGGGGVKERRHMDDVCLEHTLYEVLSVASLYTTQLPSQKYVPV